MRFDIITIFPNIFDSYFNESVIKRGLKKKLFRIKTHDLRRFSMDKHKKTDDRPYGGGAGMVLSALPVLRAVENIVNSDARKGRSPNRKRRGKRKLVLLSAKGKQFTQKTAVNWVRNFENIIFISGRYEGTDERIKKVLKADEISIGPYILTDGDVAVMAIISSLIRLVPGVINPESLKEESYQEGLEYPHYTRPEVLEWKGKKYKVPPVLLSGNHKKITTWRKKHSK